MSGPETTSPAVRTVPTVPVGSSGAGARAAAQEAPAAGAPWLHRSCIRRHELYRRLDLAAADAMTMVVAPAGAGKTLGVAGWLQQSRVREGAAWLDASGPLPLSHLEAVLDEAASLRLGRPGIVVVDDAHLLSGRCVRLLDQRLQRSPGTMRVVLIARWDVAVSRLVPELLGHLTVLRGDVLRLDDDEVVELIRIHARDASLEV